MRVGLMTVRREVRLRACGSRPIPCRYLHACTLVPFPLEAEAERPPFPHGMSVYICRLFLRTPLSVMQNRGALWVFTVLLALACAYQLSFSYFTSGLEREAHEVAHALEGERRHEMMSARVDDAAPGELTDVGVDW